MNEGGKPLTIITGHTPVITKHYLKMLTTVLISGTCDVNIMINGDDVGNAVGSATTTGFFCQMNPQFEFLYDSGSFDTCRMPSGSVLTVTCFAGSTAYLSSDTFYNNEGALAAAQTYTLTCVDGVLSANAGTTVNGATVVGDVHSIWCE